MTTRIYKSEKNAKIYNFISSKNQGCYKENELISVLKTDNIAMYFGFEKNYKLDISTITTDGNNRIIIKEA